MCGIAGFIDARGTLPRALAAKGSAMAASLHHRGPDDYGVWVDPAAGISLAHRRLAILDLSPAGRQPMRSSCGRLVLMYNGEIYNYAELRLELAAAGRVFRGQSDSEVLVEACAHWGVAATLKRLNGMFAFAVWDRKTRTLYLARDRVGIKPLYWARFGDLFLFGSELKALRAHDGWAPEIDRESLRAYMRRGHVPAPYSIYRGVHKLQAGELARVRLEERAGDFELLGSGSRSLRRRRPIVWTSAKRTPSMASTCSCATLSAGRWPPMCRWALSCPAASIRHWSCRLMQEHSSRPINTFTIGFGEKSFDEAAHARSVAKHLGTDHTELRISPADALDLVPELPRWFDEPMSNRSEIPTMLVSALARRQVTVALSGDGGDELFGGYSKYYSDRRHGASNPRRACAAAPSGGRCHARRTFRDGGSPRRAAGRVAAQIAP